MECRALLERVINSRELRRALRLRELLFYLGKRSLKPHAGTLREQEIGAAVFGRPEEYDTSLDNIVRVNVSELRKRLAHYFQDEGADETIIIEIPRGGYVPVFHTRPAGADHASSDQAHTLPANGLAGEPDRHEPAVVAAPVLTSPVPLGTAAPATATPATETPASAAVAILPASNLPSSGGLRTGLLAGGWLVTLAVVALLAWQNHRFRALIEPWKAEPVRAELWSEFFASGEDVDIVTADTSYALAQDVLGRPISLDDYVDYKYRSLADQPGLNPETRAVLRLILDRNNGSIGDFQAAKRFMDLDAHSSAVKLASARSYTPESIKTNNVILIGAAESNPWVELYDSRMNFFLEYEPVHQRAYIVNRAPVAGEKKVYEASDDRNRAYSVVAFLPNLGERRYALIVSGTDSQATRAAGEFVTSSEGLAQIRQKMPSGRFPFFELVLSSSRLVGTTLNTEVVAYRVHPR